MNKYIAIVIATVTLCGLQAADRTASSMLETIFKSITVNNGVLSVTTRESGQRYNFSIDDSEPRVLSYNESVTFPKSFTQASFKTRGYTLTLKKLQGQDSTYELCESTDMRSSGGELLTQKKHLMIKGAGIEDQP